jgi:glyoxylase-like metal-dependent hydrolase (beta-lactamase superfamily II)
MPDRVAPGVYWLQLGWRAPVGANAYLVVVRPGVDDPARREGTPAIAEGGPAEQPVAEADVTLVDAGFPQFAGRLRDDLASLGLTVSDIDRVLVTHYDLDHVGGLPGLDDLNVTIYAGRGDAPLVTGREAPPFSVPKGAFQRLVGPLITPPDTEVVPLDDGDTVGSFTVYETPGHTPGHVAYVSEDLGFAALGDLVGESAGDIETLPWIVTDDTAAARESVGRLAAEAPAFEVAATGHGVPFERGGHDRLTDCAERLGYARSVASGQR